MTNLFANWPANPRVKALTTTREMGLSLPPFASNNIALHVGDKKEHVLANRQQLVSSLNLPKEPAWLEQTHSTDCVVVEQDLNRVADAAITRLHSTPLAIMTADCLPILLSDINGKEIAAIHAGWRGLVNGIVENTLRKMQSNKAHLMAWIGPAICYSCFEIGAEVKDAYLKQYPFTNDAFGEKNGRIYADLPKLAELILKHNGVFSVYQSNACSFEQQEQFYSYRRGAQTGRMVSLIWFNDLTLDTHHVE